MSGVVVEVAPVIDHRVRGMCRLPYPRHPKGCPNFNDPKHSHRCPPKAPFFEQYFDLSHPVLAVVNEFDLGAHMARLAAEPRKDEKTWTVDQLKCVLYWQPAARKQLNSRVDCVLQLLPGYESTMCPEGMGVDVTKTLANAGVILEWPPTKIVRQVAFLAVPAQ